MILLRDAAPTTTGTLGLWSGSANHSFPPFISMYPFGPFASVPTELPSSTTTASVSASVPTEPPSPTTTASESGILKASTIGFIVLGVVIFSLHVIALLGWLVWRRRKRCRAQAAVDVSEKSKSLDLAHNDISTITPFPISFPTPEPNPDSTSQGHDFERLNDNDPMLLRLAYNDLTQRVSAPGLENLAIPSVASPSQTTAGATIASSPLATPSNQPSCNDTDPLQPTQAVASSSNKQAANAITRSVARPDVSDNFRGDAIPVQPNTVPEGVTQGHRREADAGVRLTGGPRDEAWNDVESDSMTLPPAYGDIGR
ncbi:unnamed protein product [Somion occarium]|uniref:Uncharacterized protein n=1 Tax=Somion occarium TaxID=3059160 RepID=A0ABP1DIS6_9APHY